MVVSDPSFFDEAGARVETRFASGIESVLGVEALSSEICREHPQMGWLVFDGGGEKLSGDASAVCSCVDVDRIQFETRQVWMIGWRVRGARDADQLGAD